MEPSEIFNIPFSLLIDNIVFTISKNSKNTLKLQIYFTTIVEYCNTIQLWIVLLLCVINIIINNYLPYFNDNLLNPSIKTIL